MPRVLLTGATGFVGRALGTALREAGCLVREAGRRPSGLAQEFFPADLTSDVDWSPILAGVDWVVHSAGFAHVPATALSDADLARVRRVNSLAVRDLAAAAARAGVERFVFLSTAKVLGESAGPEQPFSQASQPAPADVYARTKLEAEEWVAAQAGLPWVILRPPLMYGPGAKGNFRRLAGWVRRGLPLPFGAVANRRSLLGLDNLCTAVILCLRHPAAVGHRFLLADGEPVSTPDLIRAMAAAQGRRAWLPAVPPAFLQSMARLSGRGEEWSRLAGSFVVDAGEIAAVVGWQPNVAFADGVRRAVQGEDLSVG